ncbi:MAG TPA: CocE/NonD family hydrolase, partial [Nitrososphaeraceae archaeon]|nr:CocE/NonD family hydrolase [Nitrososphaeraceae archaeon]
DWCLGKIGTTGSSYLCHVQTSMAALRPNHLRAMFCIKGGFFNGYTSCIRQGGAYEYRQVVWAFKEGCAGQEAFDNPIVRTALENIDLGMWISNSPILKKGYSPLSPIPSYEDIVFKQYMNSDYSEYWKQKSINSQENLDQFPDIPMLFIGSWYDIYARSTVEFFEHLYNRNKSTVQLIMGPWTHDNDKQVSGEVDFGPEGSLEEDAEINLYDLQLRWFDHWLKDIQNGVENDPAVRYFLMGGGTGKRTPEGFLSHGGKWKNTNSWPIKSAKTFRFFLDGQGKLIENRPSTDFGASTFLYDPMDPIPSIGGNLFWHDNILWPGAYDQRERPDFFFCKRPNLPLASRSDVLTFATSLLDQDLEISGTIQAILFISSTVPDTDFTVKLVDEYPPNEDYPQGFSMNITHGITRCRYRNFLQKAELMKPGEIYKITVVLYPTSNLYQRGHRIRIDISSSNFPHFDVNPNTGSPFGQDQRLIVAENTIYHNREYPSHIQFPAIL